MTYLHLTVERTDGSKRVERQERDDARGRAVIDRIAETMLPMADVARILRKHLKLKKGEVA